QPVDVGFAGPVVAAFDGVVEQPVDAVPVVAVVLRRVDAALRGNAVRAPRAVLVAERLDVVPGLAQGGRRGGASQTGTHDDDRELAPVRWVHQSCGEAALVPALRDRPVRGLLVA